MPLSCNQATAGGVQGPRELGSRACKADMAEGAPRHWRQRYEATGEGAFAGLQVRGCMPLHSAGGAEAFA